METVGSDIVNNAGDIYNTRGGRARVPYFEGQVKETVWGNGETVYRLGVAGPEVAGRGEGGGGWQLPVAELWTKWKRIVSRL